MVPKRTTCILVVACLLMLVPSRSAVAQSAKLTEYQVKAAFLFNFAKFVEWPQSTFSNDTATIDIGVYGHNPFGKELDKIVLGRTVKDRSISIRYSDYIDDLLDCQLIFVGTHEKQDTELTLDMLKGKSILTVSDAPDFIRSGGMIALFMDKNKVRFGINAEIANQEGLSISSKLLKLARSSH